ncbi:hypothetical protein GF373_15125 [bacterium]|nr:hypothetical protein [bacterium]
MMNCMPLCHRVIIIFLLLLALTPMSRSQSEPLKVFDPYHGATSKRMVWMEYTDARNALYHYLKDMGMEKLQEREEAVGAIQSLSAWKNRQNVVAVY